MKENKKDWGFDVKNIDKSVRPQNDFYRYANGGWLKKTTIPNDEASWGSFITLRYNTEQQLKTILDGLLRNRSHKKGSPAQLVADYYRAAADMLRRNKLGSKPLDGLRTRVRGVSNLREFLECLAYFHVIGISGLWGAFVDQDSKDSTRYLLHFWQGGLGMPERDYYLEDKPEQKRVRAAYIEHIQKLSHLAGALPRERERIARVVMDIETTLAKASMKKEDARDPEKVYHRLPVARLRALSPAVNWDEYLAQTGAAKVREVIVGQPDFFAAISKLLATTPLEDLKTYLEWHLLNGSAGLLSEKFVKENFHFYATVLAGVKVMKPLWRRALGSTNSAVGEALGKLYVQKYFPPSSKRKMDLLVRDLFQVYAERIQNLDWMSAPTKRKAERKLRAMHHKIGYPKKFQTYHGLDVSPTDYFGNDLRAEVFEHYRQMRKLGKPIDRDEWFMYPQTVNAYFAPNLNDIVFPAAILQWPFFDPTADDALNYAGIGTVIGHEMTHGFDDQGAKFDHQGNMRTWWTKADEERFKKKTKGYVEQANKEIAAEGISINGQLTLGENIADSGGLAIGFDAYQKHLQKTGRKDIEGLSPEQRFFYAFAQMEREVRRPEAAKTQLLTDPHAPAQWRINGPLSNFEPFYKTFNVKKSDKLYRESKKRVQIW